MLYPFILTTIAGLSTLLGTIPIFINIKTDIINAWNEIPEWFNEKIIQIIGLQKTQRKMQAYIMQMLL